MTTKKIIHTVRSEKRRNPPPGGFTFDEPFTGGTPAGADAEVTDPEWFWIGVAQEWSRVAFLANRESAVVPSASFARQIRDMLRTRLRKISKPNDSCDNKT